MARVPPSPMLGEHSGLVAATLALHLCIVRSHGGPKEAACGGGVNAGEQLR